MITAQVVFKQLKDDFPSQDAEWVLNSDVSWAPLASVPLASIDFTNEKQWNAYEHTAKIAKFVKKIKAGDRKPVILARVKGNPKLVVLDGHHRSLAHEKLKQPVRAYVCTITGTSEEAAMEMHTQQRKGDSGPKSTAQKFSNVMDFTPMTAVSSTVQHPFAKKSKSGLWHVTGMQLAPYIQNVAHALLRKGHAKNESEAIHMAYGIVKKWAQGKAGNGKHVTPEVQAAAGRNVSDMDVKRMKAHMKHQTALSNTYGGGPPSRDRGPNSLTSRDFHKVPAAMRRYRRKLEQQGVPKDQALKQTIAVFQKLKSSPNPILKEASVANLQALKKRKGKITSNGEAGGDTGVKFKQMHFANMHHDGFGKFTGNAKERERILSTFQESNNLEVTGIMDDNTRDFLRSINKAANED